MSTISLTREQISKLISVYEHFKEIQSFNIKLEENNQVCVSFDLIEIKPILDKSFIPKIIHR
jgi:hypothetical protein